MISPLAKAFQKRVLFFVIAVLVLLTCSSVFITEWALRKNLRNQAESLDNLVNLQLEWMHRNAPLYTAGSEGVVVGAGPEQTFQRVPEMLIQQWGKSNQELEDVRFFLASTWPLNPQNIPHGRAKAYLDQLELGLVPAERQWWQEGDHFTLFRPIAMRAECESCHKSDVSHQYRGALIWEIPSNILSESRWTVLLASSLLAFGALTLLFFLVRRFFFKAVTQPLSQLEHLADSYSHGNFDGQVQYDAEDEIQSLLKSILRLKKSLQMAMKRLQGEAK
ncbi:MAG: DUF3365 domain-containing protein [Acidobacteria bacterium]|nr:DUF3365 domain-containing protein [Acidobacteriota bacterium]